MYATIVSKAKVRPAALPIVAEGARPIYAAVAITWIAALSGTFLRDYSLAADEFVMAATLMGSLVGVGLCIRGRGYAALATMVEVCGLFMAGCVGITLLTFVLGASDRPLIDPTLAAIDRVMFFGFDWPATMLWLSHRQTLMVVTNWVYESIGWQPLGLVALLCAVGQHRRVWTFLLAWMTTLFVTCAVFALYPGVGAYAYFGLTAADVPAMRDPTPWHQAAVLAELRDGGLRHIGFVDLDGIVTFPSFHAAAAVILAWAASSIAGLRWPAIMFNAAMLVSAIPIGGHYIVDIVAGCVVAAIGISIARWFDGPANPGETYFPPSRRVSAATQLARSIVLPSGSRASI